MSNPLPQAQPIAESPLPDAPPRKRPPLTVVAEGTSLDGRLQVAGDLRVDGRVDGALLAAGATCEIGATGAAQAECVRAATLVVHGALRADEVAARRVTIAAGGALHARLVRAEAVEVAEGGVLDAMLETARAG
jgi:cytoskeletal protein CcmA (bactofilin family)